MLEELKIHRTDAPSVNPIGQRRTYTRTERVGSRRTYCVMKTNIRRPRMNVISFFIVHAYLEDIEVACL